MLCLAGCAESDATISAPPDDQLGDQSLTGENLAGSNLTGVNLAGSNLVGAQLGGVNLGGTNLAGSNLGGNQLAGTNLGGNNLGGNQLSATNLAGANLSGTNLAGLNLAGSNLGGTNLAGTNLAAAYAYPGLCPMSTVTQNLGTDLTLATVGKAIHGAITPQMLNSGEDLYTRQKSCVVTGLGSSAFGRFVAYSSGTVYAALKQLPWNFKGVSPAPDQAAWEVVFWTAGATGNYSVFIIVSPLGTTWEGVAGYIKAVWRWAAPTTRTINIGQIGGGKTVQVWPGMMNAAWAPITEEAYVAGMLSFAAATTNNIVVNVDYASWGMNTSGNSFILGNFDPNTRHIEAEFINYDLGVTPKQYGVAVRVWPATTQARTQTYNSASTAIASVPTRGMYITYEDFKACYDAATTKPQPKRCSWAAKLNGDTDGGFALPAGKCDSYLLAERAGSKHVISHDLWDTTWSQLLPTSQILPINRLQTIPWGKSNFKITDTVTGTGAGTFFYNTVGGTTMAIIEVPWVEGTPACCIPATDATFCATAPAVTSGLKTGTDNCGKPRTASCGSKYSQTVLADWPHSYWRLNDSLQDARNLVGGMPSCGPGATCQQSAAFYAPGAIANDPDLATGSLCGWWDTTCGGNYLASMGPAFAEAGNVPFSVEAWVKPVTLDAAMRAIAGNLETVFPYRGWALVATNSTVEFQRTASQAAGYTHATATLALSTTAWSHVVGTYDGATLRLYVNGALIASAASPGAQEDAKANFTLGGGGGARFQGYLDEAAMYDLALTAAQVTNHYNKGRGL